MGKVREAMDGMNNAERQAEKILHQKAFIETYPVEGTIGNTMKALSLSRSAFYSWLKEPTFNAVYQELKLDRIDSLVSRLYKYIKGENDENGEPIKLNQQQLLASFFLLKSFAPKIFSDRMQLQHTGADGAPVKVTTVEIHRPAKADSSIATAEELKETVADGDRDAPEI